MAAARTAARGLSDDDLQAIRGTLAAGRKPKVMFTEAAGQMSGQLGQVVQLTDPARSDEWVVVRFGRDELPFSPGDLRLPPRGAASARKPEPKTAAPGPPGPALAPELLVTRRPVPAPREETTVTPKATPPAAKTTSPAAKTGPAAAKTTLNAAKAAPPSTAPPPAALTAESAAGSAAESPAEAKPARRPGRTAKPKAPASLTVTLAYTEGEWTVGATQGSKALAKPYLIKPAEALKMVGMLDVPGVHEAVEQIVAAERAEAEAQADKLRNELAEIEARLAELRAAGPA